MAVFTPLDLTTAQTICEDFDLLITQIHPILAGVTNSNFLITSVDDKKFILTVVEQMSIDDLTQVVNLLSSLPKTIPTPQLLRLKNNNFITSYDNKPVTITEFILGDYPPTPSSTQIGAVANAMAHLHQLDIDFNRKNPRAFEWMKNTFTKIKNKLSDNEQALLKNTLKEIDQFDFSKLPTGIIHHDLFKDNTLFLDEQLTAIIDFYYACFDHLLLDIAITINDWCFDDPDLFLHPYQLVRPLSSEETAALPLMRRYAYANFWLSRLLDFHYPTSGETLVKDPDEMRDKLILMQN